MTSPGVDLWDAVVVGAGPSGAVTAGLLARLGYRVALLDRAHFPREKPCAEYLSPGVVEILHRLRFQDVLGQSLPLRGMEVISPQKRRYRIEYDSREVSASPRTMRRTDFDAALVGRAQSEGAELHEGYIVAEPFMKDGVVAGVNATHQGRSVTISARWVVAADGSHSVLRQMLGLDRPPALRRLGLVARYRGRACLPQDFGQMHVGHGGYCGVAPLPNGEVNVAMVVRADAVRRAKRNASLFFDDWIDAHPLLRESLSGCVRVDRIRGVSPVSSGSTRVGSPGMVLVGDAAGFYDPFTGEGIYRALRGAEIAAQALNRLLAPTAAEDVGALLSDYERRRKQAFSAKSKVTSIVQLFVRFPRLMDYALPRLSARPAPSGNLRAVLGDLVEAQEFLNARTLLQALRP